MKIFLQLLPLWSVTLGFIMDTDPCPAPSPCRCYSSRIDCAYKRLLTFPTFTFSRKHYRELTFNLQNNIIDSIPDNAFGNVMAATPETLELHLNKNRIRNISGRAFANLGDSEVSVELSDNRLTVLPQALSLVKKLKTLRLLGNAFVFLDDTVMAALGRMVETFWLDMSSVAIWPQSFSNFRKLFTLWIDNLPFHSLPANSFEDLVKLTQLEISNSKLQSVPEAICRIPQLQQFRFHHNIYMLNSLQHVLTICKKPLLNASLAYFNNNNMFSFPDNVFVVFPKLRSLNLSFNYLNKINSSAIPGNCTLYYLYLSNNEFTSIPQAVSKMPELITLVVSYNKITSVDGRTLSSLKNFRQLTISHNPLIYIDPHAFSTSFTLQHLYVEHTNMTSVPAAILHSNERSSIDLTGSPVQCTCNNMAFLHSMSKSDVESGKKFFRGDCVNANTTIKSYILNVLPTCL
ncbi:leucine-rich repeat-containing G-protein coupled receptor 5-like [Mercenaria mercenaria]|uniref:leucine-rich repeat-containing G-protein coupled receptor 5-like n=1 Tax=Mercenaria mercenaria TaxID=6596 RepID=UPI00234EA805|nr:leucine-rich repeat-containing G-protein coupled receptor 5-like [Mercenaria mercenaria]XP_045187643.2 leucine-rich repeat-containing G-protein coupled receptor 5-like [Mercenaria mercenaria]